LTEKPKESENTPSQENGVNRLELVTAYLSEKTPDNHDQGLLPKPMPIRSLLEPLVKIADHRVVAAAATQVPQQPIG